LLIKIIARAKSLAVRSERGRMVPEVGDPALRELLVMPHRFLYEVHSTEIRVVAFLHQREDFTRR
jgi:plasmid stabilization system protein ParE